MNLSSIVVIRARRVGALLAVFISMCLVDVTSAATVFFQTGASGGGQQIVSAPLTTINGTMTAIVPRFNPLLGTLTQADFEFAASITGTWVAITPTTGTSTLNLSGPTDVSGQSMGTLSVGFTGSYDNVNSSNDFDLDFTNLTLTSGAFFNSLSSPGTETMTWIFSGSSTLSTPAIGTSPGNEGFSWGGSVHVLYTYNPVPEPSACTLFGISLAGILWSVSRSVRGQRN